MIWLASFPRSGNTFVRNILFEVYGLESSTFHNEIDRPVDSDFESYPFVKTHLLPDQLPVDLQNKAAVYIVRDPRDALVSLAHHRKDIILPGSDFEGNLLEAILAKGESFFGGWSQNVEHWLATNPVILHYENLIEDPIREISKLQAIIDLPKPNVERLPTFEKLKFGDPQYGGTHSGKVKDGFSQKFFRKGVSGGWKEEISKEVEDLIWQLHGKTMHKLGYAKFYPQEPENLKKVLIDGSKFAHSKIDGITRYSREIISNLHNITQDLPDWEIDILIGDRVTPIQEVLEKPSNFINPDTTVEHEYENSLLKFKNKIKSFLPNGIYELVRYVYLSLRIRDLLSSVRKFITSSKMKKLDQLLSGSGNYQIYHALYPQSVIKQNGIADNKLVTVHDLTHLSHPEFHLEETFKNSEEAFKTALENDYHYLSVSKHTEKELKQFKGIPESQLHTVHLAVHHTYFTQPTSEIKIKDIRDRYGIQTEQVILCLSTIEPRKNLKRTIECFRKLIDREELTNVTLVVAGRNGWLSDDIYSEVWQHPQIIFTGYVEDEDLPAIYAMSTFFCYLSHYEGFGLPLVEAMASKTPVLYGANSSMLEIVGESGLAVPAEEDEQIIDAMSKLLMDPQLRNQLAQKGWIQSMKYTWVKTAFNTLNVYRTLLAGKA